MVKDHHSKYLQQCIDIIRDKVEAKIVSFIKWWPTKGVILIWERWV
jgi:hypothetical protein